MHETNPNRKRIPPSSLLHLILTPTAAHLSYLITEWATGCFVLELTLAVGWSWQLSGRFRDQSRAVYQTILHIDLPAIATFISGLTTSSGNRLCSYLTVCFLSWPCAVFIDIYWVLRTPQPSCLTDQCSALQAVLFSPSNSWSTSCDLCLSARLHFRLPDSGFADSVDPTALTSFWVGFLYWLWFTIAASFITSFLCSVVLIAKFRRWGPRFWWAGLSVSSAAPTIHWVSSSILVVLLPFCLFLFPGSKLALDSIGLFLLFRAELRKTFPVFCSARYLRIWAYRFATWDRCRERYAWSVILSLSSSLCCLSLMLCLALASWTLASLARPGSAPAIWLYGDFS